MSADKGLKYLNKKKYVHHNKNLLRCFYKGY
nr:MAG TPA: hypothetical protein [Caudoviricetes sp.]